MSSARCSARVQPDSDCLIVGAGLVGSIAALALHGLGCRVTLIERRAQLHPAANQDVRALVLSAGSLAILERYGLWPVLAPVSTAVRRIEVSDRGGFGHVSLAADDIGLEALGWACPADILLRRFNAAVIESAAIKVHWSTRFLAARDVADQIVVTAEVDGVEVDYRTRLLIAADGSDSAVRAARGIEVERLDYGQSAIVATVRAARPLAGTAFEHFTRRGPLAFIPCGGDRYVSVQCLDHAAADAAMALDGPAYLAMLERRFGTRLGGLDELGNRRRHALLRQRAETLHAPRTLIVGNAANTVHPNAAQGLNLGLRDVQALASCLAGAADPGAAERLRTYRLARQRDHQRTGALTDVLAQAFRSRLGPVSYVRRAAMLLTAHVAPLRRRLLLEASGLAALARDSAAH